MHTLYVWLASGDFTPTFDGLATFFAALVALLAAVIAYKAIMKQIRADRKNLQDQLDAGKKGREEERELQRRAVAKAMLLEIDSFYREHVRSTRDALNNWDPATGGLFDARSITAWPFPIFHGNAGSLGSLEDDLVTQIVHFYTAADVYVSLIRDYQALSDQYLDGLSGGLGSVPLASAAARVSLNKARDTLKRLKDSSPHLVNMAFLACKKLCERTGVEFRAPVIAVAAEDLSVDEIVADQKGSDAQTN